MLRPVLPDAEIHALEVFEPYVEMFGLKEKYDTVTVGNMLDRQDYDFDLVIFGDVMEHVTKDQAIELWERVKAQASWAVIACPVVHWEQGEEFGNPYEAHLHHYDVDEVHATFGKPDWEKRVVEVASFIYDLSKYNQPRDNSS